MPRKLTLTRTYSSKYNTGKWLVKLDGNKLALLKNGQSHSCKVNGQAHSLEISVLSTFEKSVPDIEPATVEVLSDSADCTVSISMSIQSGKRSLAVECTLDNAMMWEFDTINTIAEYMAGVFSGSAMLEHLNDPNNKHGDLEVLCMKDGIHIRWLLKKSAIQSSVWSIYYDEEIISYDAVNVTIPDRQLTSGFLTRLERTIHDAILFKTNFVRNEYNCFLLAD